MITLCKQLRKQTPEIYFAPPTYQNALQTDYKKNWPVDNQIHDLFSSENKSYSLSSTRSKGLSLSVKKIHFSRQFQERKVTIKNPQQIQIQQNSAKNQKKYQHSKSVHNLKGRNLNFLNNNKNAPKLRKSLGQKTSQLQVCQGQNKLCRQKKAQVLQVDQYNMLISKKLQNSQKPFNIRVLQVQRQPKQKNMALILQPTIKPSSLIKRSFLRTKQNSMNNQKNKLNKQQEITFCGNPKSRQQIAKKQFLQSYIQKPMINSIIMTTPSDQLRKTQKQRQKDPQSPVIKLKQRLQVNRINNIFQKETIISKEGFQSCASVRIQQSMIIQSKIRQNFIAVSNKLNVFQQGFESPYKLYLVKEKYLNLLISIKQSPLQHISSISQQLLIYKELTSSRQQFTSILHFYQFSLDSDRYLLIKEAYTESLCEYLQGCINQMRKDFDIQYQAKIKYILKMIQKTLLDLSFLGIRLRRLMELEDFVLVFQSIKIQNMSIFKIGNNDQICLQRALAYLQEQIMNHLNKISKGSVATSHQ